MSDTYILHLESSTKVCSVALSKNGELIALEESHDDAFAHGEKLTIFVQQVIAKAGLIMKDLSAISVASGPGSYTGLRIGVSVAKGLCYALNIPLLAIDSLTCLHELVKADFNKKNLVCAIDARRLEVYSSIYNSEGVLIKEVSADVLDENSYQEFEPFAIIGDAVPKLKELWKDREIEFISEQFASAKGQAKIAFEKFQGAQFEDVAYFEPFYLKDFYTPPSKKG